MFVCIQSNRIFSQLQCRTTMTRLNEYGIEETVTELLPGELVRCH